MHLWHILGNFIANRSQSRPLHSMQHEVSSSASHTYSCPNRSSCLSTPIVQPYNNDQACFKSEVQPYDEWRYSSDAALSYGLYENYNLSKRDFDQGQINPVSHFDTANNFHSNSNKRQCIVNTRWTPYSYRWRGMQTVADCTSTAKSALRDSYRASYAQFLWLLVSYDDANVRMSV